MRDYGHMCTVFIIFLNVKYLFIDFGTLPTFLFLKCCFFCICICTCTQCYTYYEGVSNNFVMISLLLLCAKVGTK